MYKSAIVAEITCNRIVNLTCQTVHDKRCSTIILQNDSGASFVSNNRTKLLILFNKNFRRLIFIYFFFFCQLNINSVVDYFLFLYWKLIRHPLTVDNEAAKEFESKGINNSISQELLYSTKTVLLKCIISIETYWLNIFYLSSLFYYWLMQEKIKKEIIKMAQHWLKTEIIANSIGNDTITTLERKTENVNFLYFKEKTIF